MIHFVCGMSMAHETTKWLEGQSTNRDSQLNNDSKNLRFHSSEVWTESKSQKKGNVQ